ncbi:ENTH domain-containing protein 1 [Chelonia mydas]|uniref:ENTH domain-containing protein 1 n=1 Tax=Chelonia mydas TaxID=8469 RepID=M7BVJ4_CHEMY|nr:ENTH domain-containing protein 1 [Chelonia mydas]
MSPPPAPKNKGSQWAPHAATAPSTPPEAPIDQELRPMEDIGAAPVYRAAHRAAWLHLRIETRGGTCRCFQELLELSILTPDHASFTSDLSTKLHPYSQLCLPESLEPDFISRTDLIVFSEDEQTPATTILPHPFHAEGSSNGAPPAVQAAASDSWNRSVISFPPQRSLSTSQKWGTGRRTYSTVTNTASTITLMPPSRTQSANTPKIAEILLDHQSSVPEKPATTSQYIPKPDFLPSSSVASVETLYLSPTFNLFDPLGNSVANSEILKPTPASFKQFPGLNTTTMLNFNPSTPSNMQTFNTTLHPSPRPDSTSSMATTSSFSTFSISSPDSVVPENIVQPNLIPSCGPSGLSSPHKLSSSVFFNDLKDRVTHPFSCQRSEEEESENTSILNLLPDNSRHCAGKVNSFESRILRISGGSWGAFPVQNVAPVASRSMPSAGGSPNGGTTQKALGTLEEIKNAVLGLRGDVGKVTQELQTIGRQMASLVGDIQHLSKFSAASRTAKDALCQ